MAAFGDLTAAKAVLAQYDLPAALARLGFYFIPGKHETAIFETHRERALPKKQTDGGLALMADLMNGHSGDLGALLGATTLGSGFHTSLDAKALAKALAADGFAVTKLDVTGWTEELLPVAREPWGLARALLATRGVSVDAVVSGLSATRTPAPDDVLATLAKRIEDDGTLLSLAISLKRAVPPALPFVARAWKPKTARSRPRGLPAELATLLAAFDGIPAIGVWGAAEVATKQAYLKRLAAGTRRNQLVWTPRDKQIRSDRVWRDGWIPFGQRDDEYLAIDLEPTAQGKKGQVIGVRLDRARLLCYRATLGEWLWNELTSAWPRLR